MYRGKSCALDKKGRDQYAYRDAFTAVVKDAKNMATYAEAMLAQARRRVEDLQKIVELMQKELAQPQEVSTGIVKRYAPGATGDVAQVAAGAPPPVPITEPKKRTGRGRR
jgi:DNA-binding protein H-NS